ncbi:MAG: hypothetical protein KA764_22760 [Anaerolineales bacterium]|nr:hypothetical protein [Anaerolineales bacterium]
MRRHPLLIYRRRVAGWRLPALLIAAACGLLWWFAPAVFPAEALETASWALLLGMAAGAALLLYALLAPAFAFVECRPAYLLISTPLYRLAISYSRMRTARPVKFAPTVAGLRRELVAPFWGGTALFVDLTGYPFPEPWLRFWFGWFMFAPQLGTGLQFVVPDWMALSRDVEEGRVTWKTRRQRR